MEYRKNYNKKLANARKRVSGIKGFYRHLGSYLIVNVILFFIEIRAINILENKGIEDPNILKWMGWNLLATPILWGVGLLFHAIYVFRFKSGTISSLKPKVLRDWEERQIAKYMNGE